MRGGFVIQAIHENEDASWRRFGLEDCGEPRIGAPNGVNKMGSLSSMWLQDWRVRVRRGLSSPLVIGGFMSSRRAGKCKRDFVLASYPREQGRLRAGDYEFEEAYLHLW